MTHSKAIRAGLAVALCGALGAGAGIAGSAAAPSTTKSKSASSSRNARARPPFGPGGRAVHSDEVVLNNAGTAFITETEDNGTVESVSGDQLTIKESVGSVTYKTVTLTIPSNATVRRNFAKASLGDLKAGDRVHVSQSSDGTTVFANDSSHQPRGGPGGGHGPGGPGGPPPPGSGP
jgi:hypothetical protein